MYIFIDQKSKKVTFQGDTDAISDLIDDIAPEFHDWFVDTVKYMDRYLVPTIAGISSDGTSIVVDTLDTPATMPVRRP